MKSNIIHQLFAFFELTKNDSRIKQSHSNLYVILCLIWYKNSYNQCFAVPKILVMNYSKIKSTVIYFKCLSELHLFGFIQYIPAKNASKTTMVSIIILSFSDENTRLKNDEARTFDKSNNNLVDNPAELNSLQTQFDSESKNNQQIDVSDSKSNQVKPPNFTNKNGVGSSQNIENKNDTLNLELFAKSKTNQDKIPNTTLSFKSVNKNYNKEYKREQSVSENKNPELTEVIKFFQENGSVEIEAKKFFYYYDSKAWIIGKNIKMVNWHSGAMKWILSNIVSVKEQSKTEPSKDKNYDIPL